MARKASGKKRTEPVLKRDGAVRAPSRRKAAKNQPKRHWLLRFLKFLMRPVPRLTYWGVVLGLWGSIVVAGIVGYYAAQLPSADDWQVPERPPNMRILAEDRSLIGNRGVTGGRALRLEDMSPHIAQAVIAIEDRRFHAHFGFDPIGFTRAMVRNVSQGRLREGGSTITQQLAKNLFLKPERTFGRKVQELILAVWLEAKYSKAEILELYLNRVYFGAGAFGVDAASRRYFGKSAKYVSIGEAALLAGLLKAPSRYSPAKNPELAQRRARVVVKAMQREGYVQQGKIDLKNIRPGDHAKHFRSGPEHFVADMVAKRAAILLGKVRNDIVVETTISPYLMTAANAVLNDALDANAKKRRVSQAAMVSLAPDGAIKALIGGRNYAKSQFNRVTEAKRQPGSAFKTFVWLKALENGETPNSVRIDEPVRFGKWTPQNYDNRFRGPVTLSQAFAGSLNTVAAVLTMEAGPKNIVDTAHRLGISAKLKANASLALGTSDVTLMDMTAAYTPFSNGGMLVQPHLIKRILSSEGKVLYSRAKPQSVQVVGGRELGMMNAMFRQVLVNGTGKTARLKKHTAGGKTGTSQNFRDALFIGHTAYFTTGVWFGNDDNSPTKKLTGGSLPAKVWREYMTVAHDGLKPKPLPGEAVFLAALPANAPMPTPRPSIDNEVTTGSGNDNTALRERVQAKLRSKKKTTILDLIFGN